jgi:hypothetical protein
MAIRFDVTLRNGKLFHGRLRWHEKGLDSPVSSGPWGNGALPMGSYWVRRGALDDRTGKPPFCDLVGNCWFQFIEPRFATTRTGLGLHPDGGVQGTKGCIGLLDSDTTAWRHALSSLTSDESLEVVDSGILHPAAYELLVTPSPEAQSLWPPDTQAGLER